MKIGVICSIARGTGVSLRGSYFVRALQRNRHNVTFFKPHKKIGFQLEHALLIPYNILRTFNKKFDYFIVLKPFPIGCIPAFINRFFTKSKIIVDIDDLDSEYRTGIVKSLIEYTQKKLAPYFDLVSIQKNNDLISYVHNEWKIPLEKIITIEQGVDLDIFNPCNYNREETRKRLGINNEKVLCFTGHLNYTAVEVSSLIELMKKIKNKDVKLLIVGGGYRIDEFKEKVKEYDLTKKIIFTGKVSPNVCAEMINAADICVCYYADRKVNYYRNSMKVREYLAMGKLVVCTNIGDLKRFKDYTIQTSPNIEEFEKAIIKALEKKDNQSSERRKFITDNFSWCAGAKYFIEQLSLK